MGKGDTKERIAQTAIRLFNERGTAAVSTNHIAEAAGISPGNLYYHFRNKEEIIRAIFERMIASWEQVSALPQDHALPLTDLRRILEETFSVLWEYRFFYREFVALMRRDPELGRRYRDVRERAATSISGVLDKNLRLFSRITNTLLKDKAIEDGWRHFARPISGRNLANQVEDEVVDLSSTIAEGWVALGIFWMLALTVFYQFVTRYVLNDSAAWTEEIARYLLIGVVFVGATIGVAKNSQIQVDFFYRHMPAALGLWLSRLVDVLRIAFFVAAVVLTGQMMLKLGSNTRMTIVDAPMNLVYGVVLLGFVAMTIRSIQVARVHWRRGYSVLERPMTSLVES